MPHEKAQGGQGFQGMERSLPDISKPGERFGYPPKRPLYDIDGSVIHYIRARLHPKVRALAHVG